VPTRSVLVRSQLTDTDGNPLANKPINLYYRPSGTETWLDVGTNPHVTDSSGFVSDTVVVTVPGTYDFRAEFPGDEDYEASYAELLNRRIKVKTILTLTVMPQ